jgi:hypothetical protein
MVPDDSAPIGELFGDDLLVTPNLFLEKMNLPFEFVCIFYLTPIFYASSPSPLKL